MSRFLISEVVVTNRDVHAGRSEDGPFVCAKGTKGAVIEIERNEWDGVHVKLENNALWWFKPDQLDHVN